MAIRRQQPETHLPTSEKQEGGLLSNSSADILAGLSSLTAGGLTFKRVTEERAYKNLSSQGMWDDLKPERKIKGAEILKKIEVGHLNPDQAHALLKDAVLTGEEIADKRLRLLGSSGIFKQFSLLRGHQKMEVLISTLAVGGIALGSILLTSRELFSKKEKQEPAKNHTDRVVETLPSDIQR